jgi:hypothetical protein
VLGGTSVPWQTPSLPCPSLPFSDLLQYNNQYKDINLISYKDIYDIKYIKMEKIPYDIIINNIIPYTYNIQSNLLLEDIKNYYMIKSKIMDDTKYSTSIKLELLVFFNRKFMFNTALNRHFIINAKQYNYNNIKSFSLEKKFSILFGLFTKEERTYCLNYVNNFN